MTAKAKTDDTRQSLTGSAAPAAPGLLAHVEAKKAKQAERQRLREDRSMCRVSRVY